MREQLVTFCILSNRFNFQDKIPYFTFYIVECRQYLFIFMNKELVIIM
jgi:hypothetical protein